jgi:hypothetical protein
MKAALKQVFIWVAGIGYFAGDCWLYKFSGLSTGDALILDIPFTIFYFLVAFLIYRVVAGSDENSGYWPQPPAK